MTHNSLIEAHRSTIEGLMEALPTQDTLAASEDTSFPYLRWMLEEALEHLDVWPIDKVSRWIGCVQGVMRCRGVLDFSAERDRTRPFFHKAYQDMGIRVPKTTSWTAEEEETIVRLAKAAEAARTDPGEDVSDLSNEEFLKRLFR
jgi:hypothetical protein